MIFSHSNSYQFSRMTRKLFFFISLTVVIIIVVVGFIVLLLLQEGPCGSGSFQCGNSSVCIPQKGMCDRQLDCPNGEDEAFLKCADFHGSGFIAPDWFQTVKNITNGSIVNYTCVLENFPKKCHCEKGHYLYCKHMNLKAVPEFISPSHQLKRLILVNNSLKSIEKSFHQYPSLEIIHLEQNAIQTIPNETFRTQKLLKFLFLSNNDIHEVEAGSFISLNHLERLFLDHNQIRDDHLESLSNLSKLKWLDLSNNDVTLTNISFPALNRLMELVLEANKIQRIQESTFKNLSSLTYLTLRNNHVTSLDEKSFWSLTQLQELDLSHNRLTTLPEFLFSQNDRLSSLSLGYNNIRQLPAAVFLPLTKMKSLNLEGTDLDNIEVDMFSSLTQLDFVYFSKFHYCSYVPHVPKCRPNTDGLSSSENLLSRTFIRINMWIAVIFTLIGNSLVILGRGMMKSDSPVPNMFIRNLAASDMLMGLYLLAIAIQDIRYRDVYHQYSHEWMTSIGCNFVGVMAMVSTEVSLVLLAFMSAERFLCIASPFGNNKLNLRAATISLVFIWSLGLLLALVPVLHWHHSTHYYGNNGLCFPVHIDESFSLGWQFSAFVFLGVNSLCVLVVIATYTALFISIRHTRCSTPLASKDMEVALRFFFIVFTNYLCWAPVCIIKLMVLLKYHVSVEVSTWVVVFVVPINAAINPFLYTFTTPKFQATFTKLFCPKCTSKNRRNGSRCAQRIPNPSSTSRPMETFIPLTIEMSNLN